MEGEKHSRWSDEHREICGECYNEWLDEMREMSNEAINDNKESEQSNGN